jgi:hypothetical protein
MSRGGEDVADLRSEYLRNNPEGEFNKHIVQSEVTKGMNVFEVLASWGLPHLRRGSQQSAAESWVYYTIDEHTDKVISYELVFIKDSLTRWIVDGNVPGLGTLTPRDLIGIPTVGLSPSGAEAKRASTDSGTLKKKP